MHNAVFQTIAFLSHPIAIVIFLPIIKVAQYFAAIEDYLLSRSCIPWIKESDRTDIHIVLLNKSGQYLIMRMPFLLLGITSSFELIQMELMKYRISLVQRQTASSRLCAANAENNRIVHPRNDAGSG
jgi:hypothetical protein